MFHPKKSLGQNFLKSLKALETIIQAANVQEGEVILEIGPGKGVLTQKLLEKGAKVIAIEKDRRLIEVLENTFETEIASEQLQLKELDVLDLETKDISLSASNYKIVANIPYYITGAILKKFLEDTTPPSTMTLLVQKEVAQRILARDKKESILSISVKAFGTPKSFGTVKKEAFSPKPKVDSAILHIDDISHTFFQTIPKDQFFLILKTGFGQKRKKLSNNLKELFSEDKLKEAYATCSLPRDIRAENLSLENWKCLTECFMKSE